MKKPLFILAAIFLSVSLFSQATLIPPHIVKVSYNITNNNVQIYWEPSPSTETAYYEVWYADDQASVGKISYIKVPGSNRVYITEPLQMEFQHDRALQGSNGYFITAWGNNGEESHLAPCDSTVFLNVDFDSCLATAYLTWNDYNTWRGNITGYEIYQSVDGINYEQIGSVSSDYTDFIVGEILANQVYRFYVLTLRSNPSDSSYSNRVDVNTLMAVSPSYIEANYGTAESGHPRVSFEIDQTSELSDFILYRSDSPDGSYDSIASIHTSDKTIEYTDTDADISQQPYYYKLSATNYCNNIIRTSDNIAGTILLQANAENNAINLSWNSYQNWPEEVEYYTLERSIGSADYELVTNLNGLEYTDHSFDGTDNQPTAGDICYRVTAVKNLSSAKAASSISNSACVELNINFRFEYNAFVPGSANNGTFGPEMDFIPESVTFSIFNRWGDKVFETSDLSNLKWDGTFGGKKVDQGVYRYQLEYTSTSGKKSVIHGNVTVIYP